MNHDQPVVSEIKGEEEKNQVQGVKITVEGITDLVVAQGHPGIPEGQFAVMEFGKEQFFIEVVKIRGHVVIDDRAPKEGMKKIDKKPQGREEIN